MQYEFLSYFVTATSLVFLTLIAWFGFQIRSNAKWYRKARERKDLS